MKIGENLKIKTSRGLEDFSIIDEGIFLSKHYYLLESCKYGDEVPGIIIDSKQKIKEWNWYDTLFDWFNEQDY